MFQYKELFIVKFLKFYIITGQVQTRQRIESKVYSTFKRKNVYPVYNWRENVLEESLFSGVSITIKSYIRQYQY